MSDVTSNLTKIVKYGAKGAKKVATKFLGPVGWIETAKDVYNILDDYSKSDQAKKKQQMDKMNLPGTKLKKGCRKL